MVQGYVENGEEEHALGLFESMLPPPDAVTFLAALKACANLASKEDDQSFMNRKAALLEKVRAMESECERRGFDRDAYVSSALVNAFARCGSMIDAKRAFDRLPGKSRSLVSWNILLLGHAENGEEQRALELFSALLRDEEIIALEELTFVAALKACINLCLKEDFSTAPDGTKITTASLSYGEFVHSQAVRRGFENRTVVTNTLIDLYMKCGSPLRAWLVFHTMELSTAVTWTNLILGLAENGNPEFALDLFFQMDSCCDPDAQAIVAALKSCTDLAATDSEEQRSLALGLGKNVHSRAVELGHESNSYVAATLVDMYAKCGCMEKSRSIFDSRQEQLTLVAWTALIKGYLENGEAEQSLKVFFRMRTTAESLQPNAQTLATVLSACGSAAALEVGRSVHAEACRFGLDDEIILANCLMDMFSRCGDLPASQRVFDLIELPDSVGWNTLIAGYSRVGDWEKTFDLFGEMISRGTKPASATFVCLLTACSHAGLVERGMALFQAMRSKYGIPPQVEHLTCLVDLLCRAYELDEAIAMSRSLADGCRMNEFVWTTVVNACKMSGKIHRANILSR